MAQDLVTWLMKRGSLKWVKFGGCRLSREMLVEIQWWGFDMATIKLVKTRVDMLVEKTELSRGSALSPIMDVDANIEVESPILKSLMILDVHAPLISIVSESAWDKIGGKSKKKCSNKKITPYASIDKAKTPYPPTSVIDESLNELGANILNVFCHAHPIVAGYVARVPVCSGPGAEPLARDTRRPSVLFPPNIMID